MNIRTVSICVILILKVIQIHGLMQLRTSLASSDNPLLTKILQSIDAATSDEHLIEVTVKLLKSLCVCMRDTLKAKEDRYNSDKHLLGLSKSINTEGKVLDLYKKIYNKTCFNFKQDLSQRNNKSSESWNHPNCGKDKSVEDENIRTVKNVLRSKLEHILHRALVQTRHHHKYKIKTYNLFGKAKSRVKSSPKHTLIVILTLHPARKDLRKYNVVEEDLHKILHKNSTIEIDIIDTKYDKKENESEEASKPKIYSDCHLQSLYTYLTECEKKNLTKVFRFLRRQDTIKIYIEVFTRKNHSDYINICCENGTITSLCKMGLLKSLTSEEATIPNKILDIEKSKELHNNFKNTISKLKNLVAKLNNKPVSNTNSYFNINDTNITNKIGMKTEIIKKMLSSLKEKSSISDPVLGFKANNIPNLVGNLTHPVKLQDVSRAIILLNDFVSKQTTITNDLQSSRSYQQDSTVEKTELPFVRVATTFKPQALATNTTTSIFNKFEDTINKTTVVEQFDVAFNKNITSQHNDILIFTKRSSMSNDTTTYSKPIDDIVNNNLSLDFASIDLDNEVIKYDTITEMMANISHVNKLKKKFAQLAVTTISNFEKITDDLGNEERDDLNIFLSRSNKSKMQHISDKDFYPSTKEQKNDKHVKRNDSEKITIMPNWGDMVIPSYTNNIFNHFETTTVKINDYSFLKSEPFFWLNNIFDSNVFNKLNQSNMINTTLFEQNTAIFPTKQSNLFQRDNKIDQKLALPSTAFQIYTNTDMKNTKSDIKSLSKVNNTDQPIASSSTGKYGKNSLLIITNYKEQDTYSNMSSINSMPSFLTFVSATDNREKNMLSKSLKTTTLYANIKPTALFPDNIHSLIPYKKTRGLTEQEMPLQNITNLHFNPFTAKRSNVFETNLLSSNITYQKDTQLYHNKLNNSLNLTPYTDVQSVQIFEKFPKPLATGHFLVSYYKKVVETDAKNKNYTHYDKDYMKPPTTLKMSSFSYSPLDRETENKFQSNSSLILEPFIRFSVEPTVPVDGKDDIYNNYRNTPVVTKKISNVVNATPDYDKIFRANTLNLSTTKNIEKRKLKMLEMSIAPQIFVTKKSNSLFHIQRQMMTRNNFKKSTTQVIASKITKDHISDSKNVHAQSTNSFNFHKREENKKDSVINSSNITKTSKNFNIVENIHEEYAQITTATATLIDIQNSSATILHKENNDKFGLQDSKISKNVMEYATTNKNVAELTNYYNYNTSETIIIHTLNKTENANTILSEPLSESNKRNIDSLNFQTSENEIPDITTNSTIQHNDIISPTTLVKETPSMRDTIPVPSTITEKNEVILMNLSTESNIDPMSYITYENKKQNIITNSNILLNDSSNSLQYSETYTTTMKFTSPNILNTTERETDIRLENNKSNIELLSYFTSENKIYDIIKNLTILHINISPSTNSVKDTPSITSNISVLSTLTEKYKPTVINVTNENKMDPMTYIVNDNPSEQYDSQNFITNIPENSTNLYYKYTPLIKYTTPTISTTLEKYSAISTDLLTKNKESNFDPLSYIMSENEIQENITNPTIQYKNSTVSLTNFVKDTPSITNTRPYISSTTEITYAILASSRIENNKSDAKLTSYKSEAEIPDVHTNPIILTRSIIKLSTDKTKAIFKELQIENSTSKVASLEHNKNATIKKILSKHSEKSSTENNLFLVIELPTENNKSKVNSMNHFITDNKIQSLITTPNVQPRNITNSSTDSVKYTASIIETGLYIVTTTEKNNAMLSNLLTEKKSNIDSVIQLKTVSETVPIKFQKVFSSNKMVYSFNYTVIPLYYNSTENFQSSNFIQSTKYNYDDLNNNITKPLYYSEKYVSLHQNDLRKPSSSSFSDKNLSEIQFAIAKPITQYTPFLQLPEFEEIENTTITPLFYKKMYTLNPIHDKVTNKRNKVTVGVLSYTHNNPIFEKLYQLDNTEINVLNTTPVSNNNFNFTKQVKNMILVIKNITHTKNIREIINNLFISQRNFTKGLQKETNFEIPYYTNKIDNKHNPKNNITWKSDNTSKYKQSNPNLTTYLQFNKFEGRTKIFSITPIFIVNNTNSDHSINNISESQINITSIPTINTKKLLNLNVTENNFNSMVTNSISKRILKYSAPNTKRTMSNSIINSPKMKATLSDTLAINKNETKNINLIKLNKTSHNDIVNTILPSLVISDNKMINHAKNSLWTSYITAKSGTLASRQTMTTEKIQLTTFQNNLTLAEREYYNSTVTSSNIINKIPRNIHSVPTTLNKSFAETLPIRNSQEKFTHSTVKVSLDKSSKTTGLETIPIFTTTKPMSTAILVTDKSTKFNQLLSSVISYDGNTNTKYWNSNQIQTKLHNYEQKHHMSGEYYAYSNIMKSLETNTESTSELGAVAFKKSNLIMTKPLPLLLQTTDKHKMYLLKPKEIMKNNKLINLDTHFAPTNFNKNKMKLPTLPQKNNPNYLESTTNNWNPTSTSHNVLEDHIINNVNYVNLFKNQTTETIKLPHNSSVTIFTYKENTMPILYDSITGAKNYEVTTNVVSSKKYLYSKLPNVLQVHGNSKYINQPYVQNSIMKAQEINKNKTNFNLFSESNQTTKSNIYESINTPLVKTQHQNKNLKYKSIKTTEPNTLQLSIRVGIENNKDRIQFSLISIDQNLKSMSQLLRPLLVTKASTSSSIEPMTINRVRLVTSNTDNLNKRIEHNFLMHKNLTRRANPVNNLTELITTTKKIEKSSLHVTPESINWKNDNVIRVSKSKIVPIITKETLQYLNVGSTVQPTKRKHKNIMIKPASLTEQFSMETLKKLYKEHLKKLQLNDTIQRLNASQKNVLKNESLVPKRLFANQNTEIQHNISSEEFSSHYKVDDTSTFVGYNIQNHQIKRAGNVSHVQKNTNYTNRIFNLFQNFTKNWTLQNSTEINFQDNGYNEQSTFIQNAARIEYDRYDHFLKGNKTITIPAIDDQKILNTNYLVTTLNNTNIVSMVPYMSVTNKYNINTTTMNDYQRKDENSKSEICKENICINNIHKVVSTFNICSEYSIIHTNKSINFDNTTINLCSKLGNDTINLTTTTTYSSILQNKNEDTANYKISEKYTKFIKVTTQNIKEKKKYKNRKQKMLANVLKHKTNITDILRKLVKAKKLDLKKLNVTDKKRALNLLLSKIRKPTIHINDTRNQIKLSTISSTTNKKYIIQSNTTENFKTQIDKPTRKFYINYERSSEKFQQYTSRKPVHIIPEQTNSIKRSTSRYDTIFTEHISDKPTPYSIISSTFNKYFFHEIMVQEILDSTKYFQQLKKNISHHFPELTFDQIGIRDKITKLNTMKSIPSKNNLIKFMGSLTTISIPVINKKTNNRTEFIENIVDTEHTLNRELDTLNNKKTKLQSKKHFSVRDATKEIGHKSNKLKTYMNPKTSFQLHNLPQTMEGSHSTSIFFKLSNKSNVFSSASTKPLGELIPLPLTKIQSDSKFVGTYQNKRTTSHNLRRYVTISKKLLNRNTNLYSDAFKSYRAEFDNNIQFSTTTPLIPISSMEGNVSTFRIKSSSTQSNNSKLLLTTITNPQEKELTPKKNELHTIQLDYNVTKCKSKDKDTSVTMTTKSPKHYQNILAQKPSSSNIKDLPTIPSSTTKNNDIVHEKSTNYFGASIYQNSSITTNKPKQETSLGRLVSIDEINKILYDAKSFLNVRKQVTNVTTKNYNFVIEDTTNPSTISGLYYILKSSQLTPPPNSTIKDTNNENVNNIIGNVNIKNKFGYNTISNDLSLKKKNKKIYSTKFNPFRKQSVFNFITDHTKPSDYNILAGINTTPLITVTGIRMETTTNHPYDVGNSNLFTYKQNVSLKQAEFPLFLVTESIKQVTFKNNSFIQNKQNILLKNSIERSMKISDLPKTLGIKQKSLFSKFSQNYNLSDKFLLSPFETKKLKSQASGQSKNYLFKAPNNNPVDISETPSSTITPKVHTTQADTKKTANESTTKINLYSNYSIYSHVGLYSLSPKVKNRIDTRHKTQTMTLNVKKLFSQNYTRQNSKTPNIIYKGTEVNSSNSIEINDHTTHSLVLSLSTVTKNPIVAHIHILNSQSSKTIWNRHTKRRTIHNTRYFSTHKANEKSLKINSITNPSKIKVDSSEQTKQKTPITMYKHKLELPTNTSKSYAKISTTLKDIVMLNRKYDTFNTTDSHNINNSLYYEQSFEKIHMFRDNQNNILQSIANFNSFVIDDRNYTTSGQNTRQQYSSKANTKKYLETNASTTPIFNQHIEKYSSTPLINNTLEYIFTKSTNFMDFKSKQEKNVTNWWLDDMYLKVRLPLPINSNPGMVFPRRHFAKMEEVADLGALFIDDILDYKEMLDRGELPLERASTREKGQPLCMEQFYRLLGVCRIPEVGKDRLELPRFKTGTEEQEELIVVACRNYFYPIPVKAADRGRLTPGEIQAQLLHAMVDAAGAPPAPRVGLLTSMNRDQWARAREHLIKDETNRTNLELISRALCILCVDEGGGDRPELDPETNAMLRAMHGAGTRHHSANRWFDKTVQLIISSDGTVGMCYEHSAAEGVAVVRLAERALARAEVADRPAPPPALLPAPSAMTWNLTPDLNRNIEQAARDLDRAISDLDFKIYTYRGYGREFMKTCRTSPDVYIQLAIQYAYYKMYGYLVTTYESASLRRFRQGRVDNIRSAHGAALAWAAAMCTAETSPLNDGTEDGQKKVSFNLYGEQKKLELFDEAARKQTSIMEANILGKGIDNHLLGLREMARETLGELPPVFCDDAYKRMFEFKMSTSQVTTTTEGTYMGYGAVCPDGYGCCYNPKKDSIIFCISSFIPSSITNTEAYRQSLEEALDSMKLMFQTRKVEN